jgi:ribosomal-protein-alanine N-acetyltransferase
LGAGQNPPLNQITIAARCPYPAATPIWSGGTPTDLVSLGANDMFKDMRLETERLTIRPFSLKDTQELHQITSQKEVVKYLPEDVMSLEEVRRIIVWLIDCYEKNTAEHIIKFTTAIVWKEDEKVIGWCGLGPLDFNPSEIEIFYGLSKEFWGKGIATEAGRAMLHHGFDTIGLDEIVAVCHPKNAPSVRVIEKMGLIYRERVEKLPREYSSYEGCLYYSLSKDEYSRTVAPR